MYVVREIGSLEFVAVVCCTSSRVVVVIVVVAFVLVKCRKLQPILWGAKNISKKRPA